MSRHIARIFLPIGLLACVVGVLCATAHASEEVRFDFEDGGLQGWRFLGGDDLASCVLAVDRELPAGRAKVAIAANDRRSLGRYFASTAMPGRRPTHGGGALLESPVFVLEGDEATFLLGGGECHPSAFVALYDVDGGELCRTHLARNEAVSRVVWDTSAWRGQRVFLRVVDTPGIEPSWLLFDDFRTEGYIDSEATEQRIACLQKEQRSSLDKARDALRQTPEIVFATRSLPPDGHWYANFGHWSHMPQQKLYGHGGKLCVLDVETGNVRVLLDDPEGGVRDPQVHYDGDRILFSYRPGGTDYYHLYEIGVNGGGLRRLTDGPYDDFEPTYLPGGKIMFCSSRCKRWVPCFWTEVATLHTCEADGSDIRMISANVEQENTPWPLPDGRVLYTRWEYIDRHSNIFHHLWTMNPDGTGQMVYYGNLHPYPRLLMIDAKPIPETRRVVATFAPGHGGMEHEGAVAIVDVRRGPDHQPSAEHIAWARNYRDPYPLAQDGFLVAQQDRLMLMSRDGWTETLYSLPESEERIWLHEPRPLASRPRERAIPSSVDLSRESGTLFLSDIYQGRNMKGVERGEIEKLLVMEVLPKSINLSYTSEPMALGGMHNLERVLGTVPVEEDGSAYFEVPALRSLFLVALDENDRSVKRMQSFMALQPGETLGCVGCHERRTETPSAAQLNPAAMKRIPSRIEPIVGVPDVFDFPRDIQPILDRHCVACHDYEATEQGGPRAGGVILTGDRGPMWSHAYYTLMTRRGLVSHGGMAAHANNPPRAIGSSASRLLDLIDEEHGGANLSEREKATLRLWIETAAPYAGTVGAEGTGMMYKLGYKNRRQPDHPHCYRFTFDVPTPWPQREAMQDVLVRRCVSCHEGQRPLSSWDLFGRGPSELRYNLSRPAQSLLLLAPLGHKAGGMGLCDSEKPVFEDTEDADYQTLLAFVESLQAVLESSPRFDMPGFRPSKHYVRELKRYGVLPGDFDTDRDPIDVYETDQAYWRSLWVKPVEDVTHN